MKLSTVGTAECVQDCVAAYFQPSLRGLIDKEKGFVKGTDFVLCSYHGDADGLHHACYSNLISQPQDSGSVLLTNRYQIVSRIRQFRAVQLDFPVDRFGHHIKLSLTLKA